MAGPSGRFGPGGLVRAGLSDLGDVIGVMSADDLIARTEEQLRALSATLTAVRAGECLLCYVYRMLEFGCAGFRWAAYYRDLQAPRAIGLQRRLGAMGGYCDCEIFMNAYEPIPAVCVPAATADDADPWGPPEWPPQLPACGGVRRGSTQPCALWLRSRR